MSEALRDESWEDGDVTRLELPDGCGELLAAVRADVVAPPGCAWPGRPTTSSPVRAGREQLLHGRQDAASVAAGSVLTKPSEIYGDQ